LRSGSNPDRLQGKSARFDRKWPAGQGSAVMNAGSYYEDAPEVKNKLQ
jgi:hypothetical protein